MRREMIKMEVEWKRGRDKEGWVIQIIIHTTKKHARLSSHHNFLFSWRVDKIIETTGCPALCYSAYLLSIRISLIYDDMPEMHGDKWGC